MSHLISRTEFCGASNLSPSGLLPLSSRRHDIKGMMYQIVHSSFLYSVSFPPANVSFKCSSPLKSRIFHFHELKDFLPHYPRGRRINVKGGPVLLRAQLNDINKKPIIPLAHVPDTRYTETNDHAETKTQFSKIQYTETNAQMADSLIIQTNAHLVDTHHIQANVHLTDTHDSGVGYADVDTNACPHDQELLSSIINIAKNLPVNTTLTNYLDPYSGRISKRDCNSLLRLLGEEGLVSQTVHLLEWMGFQEPSIVSPESYSIVFPLLGKVGMAENLLAVFENMPGGRDFHCSNVYNAAIAGFAQCSRYDDAWKVFEEMHVRNIGPDTKTYSSLITIMIESGQSAKEVWQFFERISKNGVHVVSSEIFGSLIKSFCDERLMREALIVLSEMEKHGFQPSIDIYDTLIDAYAKTNQLEEAEGLFLEMKDKHLQPTVSSYNTLIDAYSRKGRYGVVEELIQEMEHLCLKPDVWTFTSLISSYGRQKKMSDRAADAFLRMRNQGIFPTSHSYTALIYAYCASGLHEKAYVTFEDMIREGHKPSLETYTILLDGYRRAGVTQKLTEIWKMMMQDGIEGTRVIFNILVDGFAKKGHCHEARNVISEFGKKGLKPNVMTYNMLINAYARAGWHTKCPHVLNEMVAAGLKPDAYTYSTLIYAYFRVNDFKRASYYHKEMIRNNQVSNSASYKKMKALLNAQNTIKCKRDKKAALAQIRKQMGLPSRNKNTKEFWKS